MQVPTLSVLAEQSGKFYNVRMVAEHANRYYARREKVEVQNYNGQETLNIEFRSESLDLPLYSIREPENLSRIADLVCSGKPAVFEAPGVFGLLSEVKNELKANNAGREFWLLKRGRSRVNKVPIICRPESAGNLIAVSKLNKEVGRVISDGKKRKGFWGRLPLHVIAPVVDRLPLIHPETFITTPKESSMKGLESVPESTICLYFQHDDDWDALTRGVELRAPFSLFGVSSFNLSGEHPPYNFWELVAYLAGHHELAKSVVGIAYDPATWSCDIASSQTQIRLPLKHEGPVLIITRPGPVSAKMIEEQTGFAVRILEGAKRAVSRHNDDFDFSPGVQKYIRQSNKIMQERKFRIRPPRLSDLIPLPSKK